MDTIIKDIAKHLTASGILEVTKYIAKESRSIQTSDYSAVVVNSISDIGTHSKDLIGHENREYIIRINIYCKSPTSKESIALAVVQAMPTISGYNVSYDDAIYNYNHEEKMYHVAIDYRLWIA